MIVCPCGTEFTPHRARVILPERCTRCQRRAASAASHVGGMSESARRAYLDRRDCEDRERVAVVDMKARRRATAQRRRDARRARRGEPPVRLTRDVILAALACGPATPKNIAAEIGRPLPTIYNLLGTLHSAGRVERCGPGLYRMAEGSPRSAP